MHMNSESWTLREQRLDQISFTHEAENDIRVLFSQHTPEPNDPLEKAEGACHRRFPVDGCIERDHLAVNGIAESLFENDNHNFCSQAASQCCRHSFATAAG